MGTDVTPSSTPVKQLDNTCCKIYHCWSERCCFSKQSSFSLHCQAYEAGRGRGNCCPLDVEAGRRTTSSDPYPIAEFHSDSKKWHWQRQRHLSVYISLSVSLSLKPCSPQLRWLASLFPFFLSPSVECQPRAVRASRSLFKLMLQWDWPARHTWCKECSVNHTSTIWNENEGFRLCVGWRVALSRTYCFSLRFLSKMFNSQMNPHKMCQCLELFFFLMQCIFFHTTQV